MVNKKDYQSLVSKLSAMEHDLKVTDEKLLLKKTIEELTAELDGVLNVIKRQMGGVDSSKARNYAEAARDPGEDPEIIGKDINIHVHMIRIAERIYSGLYGNSSKLLITPTELSVEHFMDLRNDNVMQFFESIELKKKYLVAEHCVGMIPHFRGLYEEFEKVTKVKTRKAWVDYCKDDLFVVCQDVVNGWKYLNGKGFSCGGNMDDLIFVRKDGRGVLMPRAKQTCDEGDFQAFVRIIKQVINMQPDSHKITTDESVPYRLRRLIWSAGIEGNLDSWLFDCPSFWDHQKCIFFLLSVDHLLKRDKSFCRKMTAVLDKVRPLRNGEPAWAKALKTYPRLLAIYEEASGEDALKPAPYHLNVDRIRFSRNVLMHFIDEEMNLSQILQELESVFPNLIADTFYAICETIHDKHRFKKETRRDAQKACHKWTSKGGIFYS